MTDMYYSGGEPLTLTLCLEEDSILVSRAILEALEHPKQVQMLINDERRMLLLQACSTEDREAVVVPPLAMQHFEMSGHSLLKRIRKITSWTDSRPRVVCGNYIPMHHAIVFDLCRAEPADFGIPLDGIPEKPN